VVEENLNEDQVLIFIAVQILLKREILIHLDDEFFIEIEAFLDLFHDFIEKTFISTKYLSDRKRTS
jgi:hypothetical protein